MLRAFSLAVGQMFSGPILGVLGACAMLSIACFGGLWFGIDWAIETWLEGSDGFLAELASTGGGLVAALGPKSQPLASSSAAIAIGSMASAAPDRRSCGANTAL